MTFQREHLIKPFVYGLVLFYYQIDENEITTAT